jgi:aldose 1-epimerase
MSAVEPHVLHNEWWQVGLLPGSGMSTAFGRIAQNGTFVDFMRPTPAESYGSSSDCSSYLLAPWSNRVKNARFRFRGKDHQLEPNFPDGTAIHGVVKGFPWRVEAGDGTSLVGTFDSRHHPLVNFPFAFAARAEFQVDGRRFTTRFTLENTDAQPMPAGFGHHPYFQRTLTGEEDHVELQIPCSEHFELVGCIPGAPPVAVDPRVDFRTMRRLGERHIDDCLTTRAGEEPVRFRYAQSGVAVSLHFDPLFATVVLYVPQNHTYFAVEPVTNANDGFNLYDKGIRNSGVFVLEPGEERSASFVLAIET